MLSSEVAGNTTGDTTVTRLPNPDEHQILPLSDQAQQIAELLLRIEGTDFKHEIL